MQSKVSARDYLDYSMWLNNVEPQITPGRRQEIADAEAEMRLDIQIHSQIASSDDVNSIFYQRVDGRTLHDFLVDGLSCKVDRLQREAASYGSLIDADEKIRAESGGDGTDSADYQNLLGEIAIKRAMLQQDQDRIRTARAELKELDTRTP
jgi:hypothetical protein